MVQESNYTREARDVSTVGSNSACSNRRSRENKHGDGKPLTEGRISLKKPICHRYGQKGE